MSEPERVRRSRLGFTCRGLPLLHRMRQFMGEEVLSRGGIGIVFTLVEVDVAAVRKGLSVEVIAQLGCFAARMKLDAAEIFAEAAFHLVAGLVVHWGALAFCGL